jgi:amino acid adenylation domain-containing protein
VSTTRRLTQTEPGRAGDVTLTGKEYAQWMLHRLAPDRGICNIARTVRVDAALRWWPMREAFTHLVRRHPALRASFQPVGGHLRKRLLAAEDATIDLPALAGTEESLLDQLTELVSTPMDIERGPLVRPYLIMLPSATVVCIVGHHIAVDDFSMQVLLRELAVLYDAYAGGVMPPELDGPAPVLPPEVAADETTVAYWRGHLAGIDPTKIAIAGARPAPSRPTFAGDRIDVDLSCEVRAAVARLRSHTRTTDNIVLLAAFYLLLARHGAGPDLAVGVPASSRPGGSQAVGFHASMLPIRVRVDLDRTFDGLVRATRDAFLGGLEHRGTSFESIQHLMDIRSGDWRAPLLRYSFNYLPTSDDRTTLAGHEVRLLGANRRLSRFDLELIVTAKPNAIETSMLFSTEVHDPAQVARLLERYQRLVVALDEHADRPVGEVPVSCPADDVLLVKVNDTATDRPARVVADLVADHTRLTPGAPAIGTWTYQTLAAAASGIRDRLGVLGVRPGEVVAIHAERGPHAAAAALGVWAAGGVYLPLDPAHPVVRTQRQLNHAGVRIILADRGIASSYGAGRHAEILAGIAPGDPDGLRADLDPRSPAYLLYTSGSTGQPKGVAVTHASLANLIRYFVAELDVTPDDRVLWLTTFAFDISALELFVALAAGAAVVVANDRMRMEPAGLGRLLQQERVTVVQATPTTWRQMLPGVRGLLRGRRVLCGGEPLTAALAEELLAEGGHVYNLYGPTETTIWSTAARLSTPVPERVPIGRPIANTTIHVVDAASRPVLPGTPGELLIGGAGVAVGYRGDPQRTAQAFRTHTSWGRVYHTGDLVALRADGQLEFHGRRDRQVKVRGHRVEIGEVESVIEEVPWVRQAAVIAELDPAGHTRLVAAVRHTEGEAVGLDLLGQLREHAAARLPAAAVPARFVVLTALPMTGNGKVDNAALVRLIPGEPTAELPADPALRRLVELWRSVLGNPGIDAESNFFLSGGHSLIAVELANRISGELGVGIEFTTVFEAPTPASLLDRIRRQGAAP